MSGWSEVELSLVRMGRERGLSSGEIVAMLAEAGFSRSQKAVTNVCQRMGWHARVVQSPIRRFNEQLVVEGDALVLMDIHAPLHDAEWVNRVVALAKRVGIQKAIVGGDLVDLAAFSVYGNVACTMPEMEILAAEQVVRTLAEEFVEVVYFAGNHEMRLARTTNHFISLQRIMELWVSSPNVRLSDYHWCTLVSGGVTYQVEHPRNYSRHALLVAKDLAAKYGCNVICGHGHKWGIGRDDWDRYWAIDSGVCCDVERVAYVALRHDRSPKWISGAVLVLEGTPLLLGKGNIGFYEQFLGKVRRGRMQAAGARADRVVRATRESMVESGRGWAEAHGFLG